MVTIGALHPQENMPQPAAFKVFGKFLLQMKEQRPALRDHHMPERRLMPLGDLDREASALAGDVYGVVCVATVP